MKLAFIDIFSLQTRYFASLTLNLSGCHCCLRVILTHEWATGRLALCLERLACALEHGQ